MNIIKKKVENKKEPLKFNRVECMGNDGKKLTPLYVAKFQNGLLIRTEGQWENSITWCPLRELHRLGL